jgi:hypothetical protein
VTTTKTKKTPTLAEKLETWQASIDLMSRDLAELEASDDVPRVEIEKVRASLTTAVHGLRNFAASIGAAQRERESHRVN